MKSFVSLMWAAVFALAMIPAQAAGPVAVNTLIVTPSVSAGGGDGADNRLCKILLKQGKERPGFCGP